MPLTQYKVLGPLKQQYQMVVLFGTVEYTALHFNTVQTALLVLSSLRVCKDYPHLHC